VPVVPVGRTAAAAVNLAWLAALSVTSNGSELGNAQHMNSNNQQPQRSGRVLSPVTTSDVRARREHY
jgi:hypothetical protein